MARSPQISLAGVLSSLDGGFDATAAWGGIWTVDIVRLDCVTEEQIFSDVVHRHDLHRRFGRASRRLRDRRHQCSGNRYPTPRSTWSAPGRRGDSSSAARSFSSRVIRGTRIGDAYPMISTLNVTYVRRGLLRVRRGQLHPSGVHRRSDRAAAADLQDAGRIRDLGSDQGAVPLTAPQISFVCRPEQVHFLCACIRRARGFGIAAHCQEVLHVPAVLSSRVHPADDPRGDPLPCRSLPGGASCSGRPHAAFVPLTMLAASSPSRPSHRR